MTDKTLSQVNNEVEEALSAAMKYIASEGSCLIGINDLIKTRKLLNSLVKREELLREALEVSQWIITKGKAGKYEDINAVSKNEKALSLTGPNQPWKG